jgi:hypothetical protein
MQRQLRVGTAGVRALASGWSAWVDELATTVAPAGLGLSCQASAAAVNDAQADVTAFTAALAARVGTRAAHVAQADSRYITNELDSANQLTAIAHPMTRV